MVHLTETESELVQQLLSAISETIHEAPDIDAAYSNKTKVQKLLYFAIDEFDLPITYSWYLAGAVIPDRSIGSTSMIGPQSSISAPSGPTIPGAKDEQDVVDEDTQSIDQQLYDATLSP